MEKPSQLFDVCIVCALPEEARAFLEVLQQHCEGALEEHVSSLYQYSYRFATLKNNKGEPLHLHVSWLPRYGPQEMTLHLSRVLEECWPRIAIMTGICAGDAQRTHLGDLVVAERTFTYDNGKFTLDEQGRSVHLHDTLTYQLDANILQFLALFDDWKPLIADLQLPPSSHESREVACHIKAMASGSAVRADNPFEDVRAPVRGTIAIDMESAALGLVMSRHPLIRWLVVKGICDYADPTKNDEYHDYAARASALYALSFIRAYVTNERLPRRDRRAGSSGVWTVPFARNPFFTGREDLLGHLHTQLHTMQTAALSQPQAISGLGGIGKTQLAVEYAYRYRQEYQAVLWAYADTTEALNFSYAEIARVLQLPERDAQEQEVIVQAVKDWLSSKRDWLLILDNADEPGVLTSFLPTKAGGQVLVTTRATDLTDLGLGFGHALTVPTFTDDQGALFLLHRSNQLPPAATLDLAEEEVRQHARTIAHESGGLPLALDQAGAYISKTGFSLATYQQIYQQHRAQLLKERRSADHPASVAITWQISFAKVEQQNSAATDLLRFCAFLAPDAIPEEIFTQGAAHLGPRLGPVVVDAILFGQAIEALQAYSLISHDPRRQTLLVHRLVQAVLREVMNKEDYQQWAERSIRVLDKLFPQVEFSNWPRCELYIAHVQTAMACIEDRGLVPRETPNLLNRAGQFLIEHSRYAEAEPLLWKARELHTQWLEPDHLDVAVSLHSLATLYLCQNKQAEAEKLYKQALALREQQPGAYHLDVAISLNSLGLLFENQERYQEAEELYQRALDIRKQQLGRSHPLIAESLSSVARIRVHQGEYEQAELLYQRALSMREEQPGFSHLDIALSLNDLGMLYQVQDKYTEAERHFQRALDINEHQLGPLHINIVANLTNLGSVSFAQHKYTEAERHFQRALDINAQLFEPHDVLTQSILAGLTVLYLERGKHDLAEQLLLRALKLKEQRLGPEHIRTANSAHNLAAFYIEQQNYQKAEPLCQQVLEIRKQQPDQDHLAIARSLDLLALVKSQLGKDFATKQIYLQAVVERIKALLQAFKGIPPFPVE